MRNILLIILALQCGAFMLEGCPASVNNGPPCVHDKPHQAMDGDPLSLEWWENEVAFEDAP